MNPQTIAAIQQALAPIAAKIGQGAQYGWDIVVRQQFINGAVDGIWAVFFLVLTISLFKQSKIDRTEDYGFRACVLGLFAFCALAAVAGFCVDGVQHAMNPGYYALDFFIHLGQPSN